MKINLISDIHLNFADLILPGGDVLIMAGDILEAGHLRLADNLQKNVFLADQYRRFLNEELVKYNTVLYVLGNHEHYKNDYQDTYNRISKELPSNTHLLEAAGIRIDNVYFFGGTFWTDMNKGDTISMHHLTQSMHDFAGGITLGNGINVKASNGKSYYTSKFTPDFAKGIFYSTVEKCKQFVEDHPNDNVVIISHHAPSPQSIHEFYKNDYHMNAGYHSNLDDFILRHPQIKYFVHGHMHDPVDYMIGTTRILSNPRGYKGHEYQAELFNPNFSFEI